MNLANRAQITKIHVLKSKLGLTNEHYRDMLASYSVCTSTNLKFGQAIVFIRQLTLLGNNMGVNTQKPTARGMISPGQIGMVVGMWFQISRQPTNNDKRRTLDTFIKNKWRIDRLEWVPSEVVPRIVRTLKAMGAEHVK